MYYKLVAVYNAFCRKHALAATCRPHEDAGCPGPYVGHPRFAKGSMSILGVYQADNQQVRDVSTTVEKRGTCLLARKVWVLLQLLQVLIRCLGSVQQELKTRVGGLQLVYLLVVSSRGLCCVLLITPHRWTSPCFTVLRSATCYKSILWPPFSTFQHHYSLAPSGRLSTACCLHVTALYHQ